MTTNRQAMCQRLGHDWTPWGLWRAIYQANATPPEPSGPEPAFILAAKARNRQCVRCGHLQEQSGDGTIRDGFWR